MSFIQTTYRKLFPAAFRVQLWRLRNRIRGIPAAAASLRRRVSFQLHGRCHACQSKRLSRYENPQVARLPFDFYKCLDCGFILVLPPANLSEVYSDTAMPEFGSGEEVWNQHYLATINKHQPGKGRLLEIGFGNGSFLKLAHEDGWEVHGAELSQVLVKYAQEELKLPNIRLGTIEELGYADNFFDAVAGFNFIEHVPDPLKTTQDLWRILKPSGIILLMCPNISGIFHRLMPEILGDSDPLKITWVPPHHLSYFDKSNLKKLLERAGFEIVGDESHLMSSLWRQFEVTLGPEVTDRKLQQLLADIRASTASSEQDRIEEFHAQIKNLLVERMTWTMISDLMAIEPHLGGEVGALVVARKGRAVIDGW